MCGILGIYNFSDENIINRTISHLKNLQNRGRDSYGLFFYSDKTKEYNIIKDEGDIEFENLNNDRNVNKYNIALGYTRYATSYKNAIMDKIYYTQPFLGNNEILGEFYLIHNGNLNIEYLRNYYNLLDKKYDTLNDTQILVKIIENLKIDNWKDLLIEILYKVKYAFSLIIYELKNGEMYILKDQYGLKPLSICENELGFMISSENINFSHYRYICELKNNSIYRINRDKSFMQIYENNLKKSPKLCLFEYIYFQNANTKIYGMNYSKTIEYDTKEDKDPLVICNSITVKTFRKELGYVLGKLEDKIYYNHKDIIVIGAPDTGIPYGQGYAKYLDFNYCQFISKVKNEDRSFILNTNEKRIKQIKKKFCVNENINIKDKIIYFVDDSLIRGNTIKVIIDILRSYKPKEIHIRIGSPKILYPCYYGIDIPTKKELIMNKYNEEEFCKKNKVNSLKFLDIIYYNFVMKKLNKNISNYCSACFTGKYLDMYDF